MHFAVSVKKECLSTDKWESFDSTQLPGSYETADDAVEAIRMDILHQTLGWQSLSTKHLSSISYRSEVGPYFLELTVDTVPMQRATYTINFVL